MQVLVGSDTVVTSPTFTGADGETPAACDSTPTVVIVDHAGVELTAPDVTAGDDDGIYTIKLDRTDHTGSLALLQLTWTGTVDGYTQRLADEVEVVGGFYASLPSIRQMPGLEDTAKYPTWRLRDARDRFERMADRYRGTSFVPRLAVQVVRPEHWCSLTSILLDDMHPRVLRSIIVGDTAVDDLTVWQLSDYGLLYSETSSLSWTPGQQIVVAVEHGYDSGPPGLGDACREYIRSTLLKETSGVDRDVIWQSYEGMVNRYSTPDWNAGRPTGWITVDQALNEITDERLPVIR